MVPSGECPHTALPSLPPGTRALRRISIYVAGTGLTSIVLALDSFAPASLLSEIPVFPRAVVPVPILLPVALLHGCIALFFAYGLHRLDLCAANLGHFIYLWATGLTLAVNLMYATGPAPITTTLIGCLGAVAILSYLWNPVVRARFR